MTADQSRTNGYHPEDPDDGAPEREIVPPKDRPQNPDENRYLPVTWAERAQAAGHTVRATPRVRKAQERRRIIDLIVAGRTEREVSEILDIKADRVSRVVTKVLETWKAADIRQVEQLRQIQLARLDAAIRALMPKVEDGNLGAIDRLAKVEDLRSRIAGTEKPIEHRHSHDVTHRLEDRETVENLERAWQESTGTGEIVDGDAEVVAEPVALPAGDNA